MLTKVPNSSHSLESTEAVHIHGKDSIATATLKEEKLNSKLSHHEKQSFGFLWRSAAAGGLAGTVAKTAVAPLDRVKILFQASNPRFSRYAGSWLGVFTAMRDIKSEEGIHGLFRGHSATIIRIFPYAAIKFLAYEQFRSIFITSPSQETPLRRLLSGSLAGVTSVFLTYPLEVIRVRLAFETKKDFKSGFSHICKTIYRESQSSQQIKRPSPGIQTMPFTHRIPNCCLTNFYRGFSVTVIGMLPYAGMSFLTHDTIRDLLRHPTIAPYTTIPRIEKTSLSKVSPLCSWAQLCAGGIAGVVSQTCAYPFEIIRRRMQVGGAIGDRHHLRIRETVFLIIQEKGIKGFWVGITIGYVKMVPMVAISFYVYERAKTWLEI